MLHAVATRCGIAVHSSVERAFIEGKRCLGLRCQHEYSFRPGEVLAVVPFWCCPSPLVALASPWGDRLRRSVGSYEGADGNIKVAFPRDSALTAVFAALAISDGSPIQAYLQYIEPTVVPPLAQDPHVVTPSTSAALQTIDHLMDGVADALLRDVCDAGLHISSERLKWALRVCQSRCMDVPDSDTVFGGPAVVPVADLVNHDDREPNVSVRVVTDQRMRAMVKRDKATGDRCVHTGSVSSHCPFFCIMVSTDDIRGGTELTYQYLDPEADPKLCADPLFWASRFHIQR